MTPEIRRELYGLIIDVAEPLRALVRFMDRNPSMARRFAYARAASVGINESAVGLEEEIDAES